MNKIKCPRCDIKINISKSSLFIPKPKETECFICGLELNGWIYYQKQDFKICHFCYNMLEKKGDED